MYLKASGHFCSVHPKQSTISRKTQASDSRAVTPIQCHSLVYVNDLIYHRNRKNPEQNVFPVPDSGSHEVRCRTCSQPRKPWEQCCSHVIDWPSTVNNNSLSVLVQVLVGGTTGTARGPRLFVGPAQAVMGGYKRPWVQPDAPQVASFVFACSSCVVECFNHRDVCRYHCVVSHVSVHQHGGPPQSLP